MSGVAQKRAMLLPSTKVADVERAKQGVWFPMRPNV
jgi:hypothetical protein